MARHSFQVTPVAVVVGLIVAAGAAGGVYVLMQGNQSSASVTSVQQQQQANGEFRQALIHTDQMRSPFTNMNGFNNMTVDYNPSAGQPGVLDQATAEWDVANGTDLGLKQRTAVLYFQTDGPMNSVSVDLRDQLSNDPTFSSGDVKISSINFYDYGAAVQADQLSAGQTGVNFKNVQGTGAQADVGSLSKGQYAVVPTYEFSSGVSANSNTGVVDKLSTMTVRADTSGNVNEINNLNVQTRTK